MDEGEYEEVKGEFWHSTFNKQKRPDTREKVKKQMTKFKPLTRGNRYFSTDVSESKLKSEINHQNDPPPAIKSTKFKAKNI